MHRPEVTRDLKARLLPTGPTEPGVLALCALQGMGGIGKSTLAAALAHDPEVQDRFPDGVLWATLGQQPDILPLLSGWVQALGDYQFKPLVVEIASAHLRSLLQDKAALIVVDDVWAPAHVPPFLVGGPSCRVLITTRRATVADVAGAGQIPLGVLTPEQSLVLLAYHLGRDLGPAERDDARQLAEAVGFLPLALELAAVRVRRGVSWTELRRAWRRRWHGWRNWRTRCDAGKARRSSRRPSTTASGHSGPGPGRLRGVRGVGSAARGFRDRRPDGRHALGGRGGGGRRAPGDPLE